MMFYVAVKRKRHTQFIACWSEKQAYKVYSAHTAMCCSVKLFKEIKPWEM